MEITLKALYDQAKALRAGQAHFKVNQIFNDREATGVVGIYIGERPSHEILDDLVEWAEENGNGELLDKIQDLAKPIL